MTAEQMVSLLRAAGNRVTRGRRAVLTVLERNPHLEAAEIFEHAVDLCSTINLSTVYRTLSLLHALGVVEAAGFGEPHRHFESHHAAHYHAVCQECGAVLELPPTAAIAKLASASGFDVIEERVELVGVCRSCREKTRPSSVRRLAGAKLRSKRRDALADELRKLRSGGLIELVADDEQDLDRVLGVARGAGVRLTRVRARDDGMHLWMQKEKRA